jgi:hypothetical protein
MHLLSGPTFSSAGYNSVSATNFLSFSLFFSRSKSIHGVATTSTSIQRCQVARSPLRSTSEMEIPDRKFLTLYPCG